MSSLLNNVPVWVLDEEASDSCKERIGDARCLADALGAGVGVLLLGGDEQAGQALVSAGADMVLFAGDAQREHWPTERKVEAATAALPTDAQLAVFAGGDPPAREWAARLAVERGWRYICPALMVARNATDIVVTRLDVTGKRSRQEIVPNGQSVVISMRPGVAEPLALDATRTGRVVKIDPPRFRPSNLRSERVPADPATIDIRHADRLVAGGRGLGSEAGFQLLRRFAQTIDASVAASRMAVDLGWIEFERQVGQTGKTVQPELYIACGISGASHHLQGMSDAEHIIAINTDPHAPIFSVASLGLVSDLHNVLEKAMERLTID